MNRPVLAVRADGTPAIGAGHVMRSLALAQAWQRAGGAARWLAVDLDPRLASRVERQGIDLRRLADDTPGALGDAVAGADWVALDGYHLGAEHHRAADGHGARVLVVDDHGAAGTYDVDLVLDQNTYVEASVYRRRPLRTVALLGSQYALLREGFTEEGAHRDRRVLVTLGGFGDDRALALRDAIGDAAEVVVAGGDVEDMASLMRSSAVALSAAGSTALELAATGTPMVLVTVADNQVPVARRLANVDAAIDLGPLDRLDVPAAAATILALLEDEPRRAAMAAAARSIVDGRGADRVVEAMHACELELREATPDDVRPVWEWANDEAVREASISQDPIPWETHVPWFEARLRSPTSWFFIAELDGDPVGQVRFDVVEEGVAEIGVLVDPHHRGRRLSPVLISHGTALLGRIASVERVIAVVRVGNEASARAFVAAGYVPDGSEVRADAALWRFVRSLKATDGC